MILPPPASVQSHEAPADGGKGLPPYCHPKKIAGRCAEKKRGVEGRNKVVHGRVRQKMKKYFR